MSAPPAQERRPDDNDRSGEATLKRITGISAGMSGPAYVLLER